MDRGTLNANKDGISGSPSRSQDWDYDGLGNWDSLTTDGGAAQTRGHNKQNEITSISGATTPTYDSNGNLTKDETGKTFEYDAFNRLIVVKSSGGATLATTRTMPSAGECAKPEAQRPQTSTTRINGKS
jgi:hypothetical protein